MKLKSLLAAAAVATMALAGCAVDHSGQDAAKPTIRIGYQTFPSGDLIVKNNKWLEEALPDFNIKWIKFDSGADVNTAFIAKELDFGALGLQPRRTWAVRAAEHPLPGGVRARRRRRQRSTGGPQRSLASTRSPS